MCLYPRLMPNPKYKKNKKNKGNPPKMKDPRVGLVPIGCQNCIECAKKKMNEWRVRLSEEVRNNPKKGEFITLTFSEESLQKYAGEKENDICYTYLREWTERIRKFTKKGLRYWFITEKGENGTERVHMHGIIWVDKKELKLAVEKWTYGIIHVGFGASEKSVNYLIKYLVKGKDFKSRIWCSNGIGRGYEKRLDAKINKFKKGETNETYTTRKGLKQALPIYYKNKIYTEEEREMLWIEKLDKMERWVDGIKVDVSSEEGLKMYEAIREEARRVSKLMGFKVEKKVLEWETLYKIANRGLNESTARGDLGSTK